MCLTVLVGVTRAALSIAGASILDLLDCQVTGVPLAASCDRTRERQLGGSPWEVTMRTRGHLVPKWSRSARGWSTTLRGGVIIEPTRHGVKSKES